MPWQHAAYMSFHMEMRTVGWPFCLVVSFSLLNVSSLLASQFVVTALPKKAVSSFLWGSAFAQTVLKVGCCLSSSPGGIYASPSVLSRTHPVKLLQVRLLHSCIWASVKWNTYYRFYFKSLLQLPLFVLSFIIYYSTNPCTKSCVAGKAV